MDCEQPWHWSTETLSGIQTNEGLPLIQNMLPMLPCEPSPKFRPNHHKAKGVRRWLALPKRMEFLLFGTNASNQGHLYCCLGKCTPDRDGKPKFSGNFLPRHGRLELCL